MSIKLRKRKITFVENLHHVAVVNNMTIERYADCDSFPNDDFIEVFESVDNGD